ncbi:MAG: PAS domain S-box protein, partial [Bacteroidota bacterium]
ALIDNSLSAIFLTKPDGAIIEANPAAQLLFDYTLDELRNIGRQGIIDHSDATNIKEMLQKRDIHGRASGEIIGIRKNGDRFPIEFTSALFKDKNQEVFTYTILNDITEKKTAQQKLIDNEKRFRAMVENGSDAIVIFDATANLIYISPGVNRILGYTEQEALQLNSLNIIHPADGEYVRIKMQESLGKPGVPIKNICCRIKHKDGRWLYIEATITNLLHEPAIGGIVTNFSDVTQRKQIETQLSSITDNLKGVVFRYKQEVDGTNQMMYLSKGSINMWGIEAEMAMANNQLIWNLYHKDDLEAHIASIQQSKENLTEWTHEWRINHPDGSVRWQRGVGNPQRLPDGSVIWDSLIIDITAQKDLEKEKMDVANNLAERNVFIETILQNLPIGISVNKIDTGEATMINSNFSKIYGWEDKDLQNVAAFFEKVYPDETYRKEMIERVMNDIESRVPERMEWKGIEVTDQNGQKKIINAKNIPLYEQNLMISTVTDVSTEARQAAEIQKTKTDLDKIMKYSPDVVCTINEQGDFVKLSAATESIWGYTPEELIGKKYIELVHPDDREKTNLAAAAITSGQDMTNFENRYIRKDGSVVPIVWSAKWDDQEKMIFCIAKDGTEKNIAELAIIESEKKYKNLFENNPSPMFVWEFATKQIIDCNIEALMQYGYSREEFLQLSINEIRPKEDIAELEKVTANEKTYGDIHTRIWRHLRKNGELFFVEVNGHLIDYNGVKASLVMVTDITEKLTAEETIKESNQRYENVTKATYDAIWDWDMTSNKLYWGDMYTKLFGEISD